jgi:DNA processing protein
MQKKFFTQKNHSSKKIEGIGPVRAASIAAYKDFSKPEEELKFIEKFKIKPLWMVDIQ